MTRNSISTFLTSLTLIIALATSLVTKAQIYTPADTVACQTANIDTTLTVSLLTASPGREVYQLEGHSGLRFHSATADVVANWGLFDFNTPHFVYRFVKGETDYCVGIIPFSYFMREYTQEGRSVIEQPLNLTPEQANILAAMVAEAARPENRTYRYNYVLDNCATRPVVYIERAVGDSIIFHPSTSEADSQPPTFRSEMRRFHRNYPWYQFGIDLALGAGIDYPITTRQTAFAPVTLSQLAATATIGDSIPLVSSTHTLIPGSPDGVAEGPTLWYLTPIFICWIAAGLTALIIWLTTRHSRYPRALAALWFTLLAIAGCIVAFLVCISTHEATSPNWIILWVNPICAIVPATIFWNKARKALRIYMITNTFTLILYLIVIVFGTQSPNPAFIPLYLADLLLSISYIHQSRNA